MAKFDIPFIMQVDAANIAEARRVAYALLEELSHGDGLPIAAVPDTISLSIANDEHSLEDGQRIVLLRPDDAHSEYDPEKYQKTKKDDQD